MKPSSTLKLIGAGILASSITFMPMTVPASAQVATPRESSQGTTTTTTEERHDNTGLWGLLGLTGLFGLLKGKESRNSRDDAPAYRDPSIR
jgi:hypothetical protein